MPWIQNIPPAAAEGRLKAIFDAAIQRAGKVFQILQVQSLSPRTLDASMRLYTASMHAPSPLSRAQREALATMVSRTNDCHY
ncbi:MAG TPA: hypothetical protein PK826_02520 [Anaerolineae bacterium]|nr:hypothetical protein [Anaerolineae bacterium]